MYVCMYVCMFVCVYVCVCMKSTLWLRTNYLSEWHRVKSGVHNFFTKFRNPPKSWAPEAHSLLRAQKVRRHSRKFGRFGVCTALSWHVTSVCILSFSNAVQLAILYYSECLLSWSHCGLSHSVNGAFLIYSLFAFFMLTGINSGSSVWNLWTGRPRLLQESPFLGSLCESHSCFKYKAKLLSIDRLDVVVNWKIPTLHSKKNDVYWRTQACGPVRLIVVCSINRKFKIHAVK